MSALLNDALALPGAILLVVCISAKFVAPIVHRTVGRRIYVIAYRQYRGVAGLQEHLRHPLMDVLCKATALTVSVEFYLLALPPIVWLAGQHGVLTCLALCQCMAVSTYMTCVLKDMLSCPRPYMFLATGAAASPSPPRPPPSAAAATTTIIAAPGARTSTAAQSPLPLPPPPLHGTTTHAAIHATGPPVPLRPKPAGHGDDDGVDGHGQVNLSALPVVTGSGGAVAAAISRGTAFAKPQADGNAKGERAALTQGIDHPQPRAGNDVAPREVAVLEDTYRNEIEYGAPSMHTWCALVLPAYAATILHQLGGLSAAQCAGATAGAGCWAAWVALTRLYLGVHTPVDLVLGAVGGGAVLGLWRRLGLAQLAVTGTVVPEAIVATAAAAGAAMPPRLLPPLGPDMSWSWQWLGLGMASHLPALLAVGLLYVAALATYPVPESHTTSYEYAVIFLGAAYGGLISGNTDCNLVARLLQRRGIPIFGTVGGSNGGGARLAAVLAAGAPAALRQPIAVVSLGFALVAVVKLLSKALLAELLPRLLSLAPLRLRLLWQPPVHPSGCYVGVLQGSPSQCKKGEEGEARDVVQATAGMAAAAAAAVAASEMPPPLLRHVGCHSRGCSGVLMKTPTLPYDVDFLRKFLNYGVTVYAALEYRHVAELLLLPEWSQVQ